MSLLQPTTSADRCSCAERTNHIRTQLHQPTSSIVLLGNSNFRVNLCNHCTVRIIWSGKKFYNPPWPVCLLSLLLNYAVSRSLQGSLSHTYIKILKASVIWFFFLTTTAVRSRKRVWLIWLWVIDALFAPNMINITHCYDVERHVRIPLVLDFILCAISCLWASCSSATTVRVYDAQHAKLAMHTVVPQQVANQRFLTPLL